MGSTAGANNEATSTMMQKFWDSAMALSPNEEEEDDRRFNSWCSNVDIILILWLVFTYYNWNYSEGSMKFASDGGETGRYVTYPSPQHPTSFAFKVQDKKGLMHRFNCGMLPFLNVI